MTRGRKKIGMVRTLQVKLDEKTAEALKWLQDNGEHLDESSLIREMIREQRRLAEYRDKHGGLKVIDTQGDVSLVSITNKPPDFEMTLRT